MTGARRKGEECLKWKFEWKTTCDDKGKTIKVKSRKYYWICNFRKEERWRQTVLSFAGTARGTPERHQTPHKGGGG